MELVYYNEWEPYAAQWLRNLIAAGHIPAGDVDERSIADVQATDLKGYGSCHFFAGIGGWPLALRLAGYPEDRSIWTGSCPCQPFSVAGKGKAQSDERHLWPHWFRLIAEVKPAVVFGEQVAGAIAHGWLDDAFDDLEGQGYETGAAVLPACSVGAPHKRDRLWFVGNAEHNGLSTAKIARSAIKAGNYRTQGQDTSSESARASMRGSGETMADAASQRLSRQGQHGIGRSEASDREGQADNAEPKCVADFWRVEPSVGRVANGVPARVGKLRAFGNAIVPQVAAEFVKAFMECEP